MVDYTNTQIESLICEHIHHDRNAAILRLRLIHGLTYEQIADRIAQTQYTPVSPRQVQRIITREAEKLYRYL